MIMKSSEEYLSSRLIVYFMPSSRQLAAIMFTDIVGYTTLMGSDEQKAIAILDKNRTLQKPIIEEFNGRWIKELGDGVMASFNTVADAVNAAVKIQEACNAAKNFQLRIGIHQGDVIFETDDIFGDAVNIASRIQSTAKPGCIYISESVHNNVSNKKDIHSKFVKEETLKNVKEAVRIYEVTMVNNSALTTENKAVTIPVNSIAVLPFANMSSDPEQEYFSDGISEEIINMLAQVPGLKVVGRTSSFSFKGKNQDLRLIGEQLSVKHILKGSVRKAGNKLRVTAQLINVADGYHLYSENFDRGIDDIFEITPNFFYQSFKNIFYFTFCKVQVINFSKTFGCPFNEPAYNFKNVPYQSSMPVAVIICCAANKFDCPRANNFIPY